MGATASGNQEALWKLCREFIDKNKIECPEVIHDCDRVIENAYRFIRDVCNIVGYKPSEDEE